MKAIVYSRYGGPEVLHVTEVEMPVPKQDEVLIRVHATSVNYGDLTARTFGHLSPREFHMPFVFWLVARALFGVRKPRKTILGGEFAGEITAVGDEVTSWEPGDEVFGYPGQRMGAYAEHMTMPTDGILAPKPMNMTYEEAATVPYGAVMALNLLRKVDISPGQRVLINGASGAIGSAAAQLATTHFGADVTGVCSTPRLEYVKSLGADHVIDYTEEDFTQTGESYDLIFDVLGKSPFSRSKRSLNSNGIHLYASFKTKQLFQMLLTSISGNKKVVCALAKVKPEDLIHVKELIEKGEIRSVIDRQFSLQQAAEAHRYVEDGHSKGNVVITVEQ